jgi:SWI/SNF-related matrix-associated actin-dependent regulator of chromatin subfamily A member 5
MILCTCILNYNPCSQYFQYFDLSLAQLRERELAVHKVYSLTLLRPNFDRTMLNQRFNEITAPLREPLGPEDTPERLDAECQAAQDFIDNGVLLGPFDSLPQADCSYPVEPLTDDEQAEKEAYLKDGFPDWSRRDFQQLVRALEANSWYITCLLYCDL